MEEEESRERFPAFLLFLVLMLGGFIWVRFHGLPLNPALGVYYSRPEASTGSVEEADIPPEILALKEENLELTRFVDEYPLYYGQDMEIDLTREARADSVPLLLQWDKRWGYEPYGTGLIGDTGCGPTCISMVALYLTGDPSADPKTVSRYAEQNDYYAEGYGTTWSLMLEGCEEFGIEAEVLPLLRDSIEDALDEGRPVILSLSPGDFTTKGHFIVLTGYDEDGFTVNDPNSPIRSRRHWTFDTLKGQIRNIWAYSAIE